MNDVLRRYHLADESYKRMLVQSTVTLPTGQQIKLPDWPGTKPAEEEKPKEDVLQLEGETARRVREAHALFHNEKRLDKKGVLK